LGRGIHAADTPATGPTPPPTDFRDLPTLDLLRYLMDSSTHGVDLLAVPRTGRSTPCVDGSEATGFCF
ncbi:hypothetical protein, partial [Stenotrophomonas maltophilia]|uniref:hypothetical protein n=1 Tax=Stenotrophomonas maltophilia TaxID=40324 RepID=UPI0039C16903